MKSRMEQCCFLANRIIIKGSIPTVRFGCSSRDTTHAIEYRVPIPVLSRCDRRLHLTVARGEFPEGYQGTSTRGIVEWYGTVEV